MINATAGETITPDLMVDALLHILAACIASRQTKNPRPKSAMPVAAKARGRSLILQKMCYVAAELTA